MARLGDHVAVPAAASGLVWVSIDIDPTLLSHLVALVVKPPRLAIEVETGSGRRAYRLMPAMAKAGFLLSPLVEDTLAFATLASDGRAALLSAQGVRSLRVFGGTGSWLYAQPMRACATGSCLCPRPCHSPSSGALVQADLAAPPVGQAAGLVRASDGDSVLLARTPARFRVRHHGLDRPRPDRVRGRRAAQPRPRWRRHRVPRSPPSRTARSCGPGA